MPFAVLNWKSMYLFPERLEERLCVKSSKIAYKIKKINLNLRLRILAPFHWFWLEEMFNYAPKMEF